MSASPPDAQSKATTAGSCCQRQQQQREEMEQLFFVLLKRQQMQEVVQAMAGSEFGCPVCQSLLSMATLANCGHMFCQKCIRTWCVDHGQRNCPVCRVPIVARIRALPVDRFIRRCLEEAGDRESLNELLAASATAKPEEAAVFQCDRAPVRATAATFFAASSGASTSATPPYQQQASGQLMVVRSTSATSASSSSSRVIGSFGVSSD